MRSSRILAAVTATTLATGMGMATASAETGDVTQPILQPGTDASQLLLSWYTEDLRIGQEEAIIAPTEEMNGEEFPEDALTIASDRSLAVGAYSNKVELNDLQPETSYTYQVGSDKFGWSKPQTFNTGTAGDEWNFLFYGDPQLGSSGDLAADTQTWQQTVTTSTQAHPNSLFLLSAGDQVEAGVQHHHDAFKSAPELGQFPTATLMGNHDVLNPAMYYNNYAFPNLEDGNYFFERNNALIIALDSNFTNSFSVKKHIDYVNRVVEEHGGDKDWIITTFHHSPYSQAGHNDDFNIERLRNELTPALSDAGVDAVLGGHDHIYTRSHLIEGTTPVIPENDPEYEPQAGDVLYPEEGQTLYLVANSSSASKFYGFSAYDEEATEETGDEWTAVWNQDETPDYTNVEVSPTELTFSTYNVDSGDLVDEVTLSKN